MDFKKHWELISDLSEFAKKHEVSLLFIDSDTINKFEKEFEGITLFITDGSPSKQKVKVLSPNFNVSTEGLATITITKNRYKKDERK